MDLLTPSFGLIIWTLLAFVIVLLVLRKFAWGPILSALNEREKTIADSLREEGEARARAEFAERLAEFDALRAQIEHARKDANARLRASVTKQLHLKYGPLPDAAAARLAAASADALDAIAERLLFADTLEAALGKR